MNRGDRRMISSLLWTALALASLAFVSRLPAQETNAEATRDYNAAAKLHNLSSWDLAAEQWRAFIERHPGDPRVPKALHYLGVCLFNQKQYEAAAEAFRQSIDKGVEENFRELSAVYRGMALFEAARQQKSELYSAARNALEEYLRTYPNGTQRPQAQYYLAETLYFQGQKDQAAQAYRRFLQSYPDDGRAADVLFALAVCEEELGNRQAALKNYLTFTQRYPQHPRINEALYRIGEVQYSLGDFEQAELFFRKAGADSRFADADLAVIRSGDALVQLKRYEEAAQQYASVEKRFPNSPHVARANLGAAKCLYFANRYQEALPLLVRATQAPDVRAEAIHWAARCYLKLGQPQQVLDLIVPDAIQSAAAPWNVTLQLDRADALYEIPEKRAAAVKEYAQAAAMATDPALKGEALYAAAHTALGLGQIGVARQYAEQFQKEISDHVLSPDVQHIVAECELVENHYDAAAQMFDELAKKYPKNPQVGLWRVRQLTALQMAGKHDAVVKLGQALADALPQPEDQAAILTLMGASQLELDNPKAAQESLLLSLSRSPKGPSADRAMLVLAWAYHKQGRTADARTVVERMIKDFPQSTLLDRAYYELGKYCASLQDFAAAESAYRQLLQQFPESARVPAAVCELAQILVKSHKSAEAEQLLKDLLQKHAQHPLASWARYLLATLYYEQQQLDPAMQMIDQALREGLTGNERSAALYTQGLILIDKKQYDQAAAIFKQILDENPQYPEADKVLYQWAWAEKLAGKENDAITLFQRLIDTAPESPHRPEAEYHVASQLYSQGRYSEAATLYHHCYKSGRDPDLIEKAVHRLGWCFFKMGQYENAAQTFAYQKSAYPKGSLVTDAIFMEAESLFMQNKFKEALQLYESQGPLESPDYEVLRLLHAGQSAGQIKQQDRALQYYQQVLAKFPATSEAIQANFEVGMIHYDRGELDTAWKVFEKVLENATQVPEETAARAQFMLGEISMQQKKYDEAVKYFFRVAYGYRLPQWQAAALFEAARCFETLQRPEQAAKLYQELIDKFPESDRIADARAKLQLLKPQ
ncbi:tetratricopeptide repeat protein [Thermogutta sp.]|uniref:tetratricopeptide repeat protein n=1 Tax=Thermogutta sp. TaxID=1962930 RepID=UPI003C7D2976